MLTFRTVNVPKSSLPPRGAWIEISWRLPLVVCYVVAPPHGERGLKLTYDDLHLPVSESLPPRGAWIEIKYVRKCAANAYVAPPTGSVD